MTLTKERFEKGLTYDAYKASMSRNRERVEENERKVALDPDVVRYFKSLPESLNVVVLAEDWCGDVIANLPILGRLAAEVGKLNVRILYRDQNLDLRERWLNQGKYQSIPVFAFFDESFRELGHWIERPASVTELRAKKRGPGDLLIEVWQLPSTATPGMKEPAYVGGLGGRNLSLVDHRVDFKKALAEQKWEPRYYPYRGV